MAVARREREDGVGGGRERRHHKTYRPSRL